MAHPSSDSTDIRLHFLKIALAEAQKSPLKDSNFRVGAVIVDETFNTILSTGFTLEMQGNTHAEESALKKLARIYNTTEDQLGFVPALLQHRCAIYTTMEPCSLRLSGNKTCTDRILAQSSWLRTVYFGVGEPADFVKENTGRSKLREAGLSVLNVPGLEHDIIATAKAGHHK